MCNYTQDPMVNSLHCFHSILGWEAGILYQVLKQVIFLFSCNHSKPKTWCLTCATETTEVKPHFSVVLLGFEHRKWKGWGKMLSLTQIYKTISSILAMYFSAVNYWQKILTSWHKTGSIETTCLFYITV